MTRPWGIQRIEALRWRILQRYDEMVHPDYVAAVEQVFALGGAYFFDLKKNDYIKLLPVNGPTRYVRRYTPVPRGKPRPALVQLAMIPPPPTKQEMAVGGHYIQMKGWMLAYIARIKCVNQRLYDAIYDGYYCPGADDLLSEGGWGRVLRINGRLYPVNSGWVNAHDEAHVWWPRFCEQSEAPIGVIDV